MIRGHIPARRAGPKKQGLAGATIRLKLAAPTSQSDYLCWANTVMHNPVKGVKRPKVECYEGKTQMLGDVPGARYWRGHQTTRRDGANLSLLLYYVLDLDLTKLRGRTSTINAAGCRTSAYRAGAANCATCRPTRTHCVWWRSTLKPLAVARSWIIPFPCVAGRDGCKRLDARRGLCGAGVQYGSSRDH